MATTSVDVDGDVIIVGAYWDNTDVAQAGSAYVFRFNGSTWEEEQKLTAIDAEEWDVFGTSVSVHGDLIAVGTPRDNIVGLNSGSVFLYRYMVTSSRLARVMTMTREACPGPPTCFGSTARAGKKNSFSRPAMRRRTVEIRRACWPPEARGLARHDFSAGPLEARPKSPTLGV